MRILETALALNATMNQTLPFKSKLEDAMALPKDLKLDELALPSLDGNPNTVTISGFSAGAFMATQMHVINSQTIKGAGIVGGGPYGISQYSYKQHNTTAEALLSKAEDFANY